jgi:hypothetical protein
VGFALSHAEPKGEAWSDGRPPEPLSTEPKAKEMAERVGFEPTCRLPDKTLSRRPRYDHFGTSPVVRAGRAEATLQSGLKTALHVQAASRA